MANLSVLLKVDLVPNDDRWEFVSLADAGQLLEGVDERLEGRAVGDGVDEDEALAVAEERGG